MIMLVSQISEVFTAAGTGLNGGVLIPQAPGYHSLQVFGVGGSPSAWSIALQGSLDNSHWYTLLVHSSSANNNLNDIVFTNANVLKVIYLQIVCNSVTLNGATSLNAIASSAVA